MKKIMKKIILLGLVVFLTSCASHKHCSHEKKSCDKSKESCKTEKTETKKSCCEKK